MTRRFRRTTGVPSESPRARAVRMAAVYLSALDAMPRMKATREDIFVAGYMACVRDLCEPLPEDRP